MADEIRRSGRATKGQHTKDREDSAAPAGKKGKATKSKKKANEPEPEDEEEDENVRCICGQYDPDDEGRTMICCEKCEAWQHNDCMGLPQDYDPPKYYCEQCKPSDHKELLAAMKRGERPWEEAAQRREELLAAQAAKKKGKKGSRKSGGTARVVEVPRTPTLEPEEPSAASKKRKHEESPAPAQTARSKKARPSIQDESDGVPEVPATQESEEVDPYAAVAKDAKDIADPTRSKIATGIIKAFVDLATSISGKGVLSLAKGETAKSIGTRTALRVEHAVYEERSGGTGEPNEAYRDHMRAILNNIKSNPDLPARLLRGDLAPADLARMEPKDMASDEQKQKDAEEKMRMEKQHVLIEEKGPRIRRTHKGDEYIDDSHQPAESATSNASAPKPSTADQDVEMKSPSSGPGDKPQPLRKPSAAGKGKPFADPRRKSSTNFDIDKVWSGVQGSPTDAEAPKLPTTQNFGSPQPASAAAADPEVDRLLKEEENESEPYSPKDYVEEGVIWRGRVNGGSLGTFNTIAKFAAGCQPDVENLKMSWSEVIPPEIKLHGRIQPSKADDYLCGLEYSSTTELIIVHVLEPQDPDGRKEFTKFFDYLKAKERYGVGSQHQVPAIKDIYLLPMEPGQALPTVMKALEHSFPDPVQERSFLVPIVIKWTELPHNAERARQQQLQQQAAQSPSVGPPVAQTPITPYEPQMSQFEPVPYPPPQTMNGGPHPPHGLPVQAPQQTQPHPAAHAPVQAPPAPGNAQPPAAINALRILGAEMAALPAVVDLIAQAPTAGENEFSIIKECIEENAEAGKSLVVLTRSLQAKYETQRSAKEQANAGGNQAQVAATLT